MPRSKLEDYEVLSTIGSGSYGVCQKIRRKKDGQVLVWKELDYGHMSDTEKQSLVTEVNLLRRLKHKHIVRYLDRIIDKKRSKIFIIMEYCNGGDLRDVINKHRRDRRLIEESFVWRVFYQVSAALRECHNKTAHGHILHRDVKPANVFLDCKGDMKLGDFGLARVLAHDTSFAKTFVGTPYYMSPELICNSSYNEKSDVWSLGCLLYELCALVPPFNASSKHALSLKIRMGSYKPISTRYSVELSNTLKSMLQTKDNARPSIDDLLDFPWVTKMLSDCQIVQKPPCPVQKKSDKQTHEEWLQQKEQCLLQREKELKKLEEELERRQNEVQLLGMQTDKKIARLEQLGRLHRNMLLEKRRISTQSDSMMASDYSTAVPLKETTNQQQFVPVLIKSYVPQQKPRRQPQSTVKGFH